MAVFDVTVHEEYVTRYRIEADSEDEARATAEQHNIDGTGGGDSHCANRDTEVLGIVG